jgi:alanine dehydrogenase
LVTEEMVRQMKPGSVVVDVSIDQGGCFATSRPTSLSEPHFVVHEVIHYCVPNMTANIARTASRAMANAAFPYIEALTELELDVALKRDPGLARGVYLHRGRLMNERVGEILGIPVGEPTEPAPESG